MWTKQEIDGSLVWQVDSWRDYDWLTHGFTTSQWGNLALHVNDDSDQVIQRRERLSKALSFPLNQWIIGNQVHGNGIATVTASDRGAGAYDLESELFATDGLITPAHDLLLVSFYADCVPLLFIEPNRQIIAMAHAGWRGTVAEIGLLLAEKFKNEYQVELSQLQVAIGPSIGPCCYEVSSEVGYQFPKEAILGSTTGIYLDLKLANKFQLLKAGLLSENIFLCETCTCCTSDLFSYRRQGTSAGRMASFLGKGF